MNVDASDLGRAGDCRPMASTSVEMREYPSHANVLAVCCAFQSGQGGEGPELPLSWPVLYWIMSRMDAVCPALSLRTDAPFGEALRGVLFDLDSLGLVRVGLAGIGAGQALDAVLLSWGRPFRARTDVAGEALARLGLVAARAREVDVPRPA